MYRVELVDKQGEIIKTEAVSWLDTPKLLREWRDELKGTDNSICLTWEDTE